VKKQLQRYRLLAAVVILSLTLALVSPAIPVTAFMNWIGFLVTVLTLLPTVMLLMGLFDAWVPRKVVEDNIGPGSGTTGVALAVLLGTAAAGPIYAAFPIALSLQQKGARLANVIIFLGTWAAIKIPMLLLESSFIGLRFALIRLALTLPGVIGVGFLGERIILGGERS
jgi:uncharacterized membrane protein YraQ (UPF0718 family)